MTRDTMTALPAPNGFSADPLTDLVRSGARQLIEQALEAELGALLAQFSNETTKKDTRGSSDMVTCQSAKS